MQLTIEKNSETFYARLTPTNRDFLRKAAKKLTVTQSEVLNLVLDKARGANASKSKNHARNKGKATRRN